jgi:hypothetical protein
MTEVADEQLMDDVVEISKSWIKSPNEENIGERRQCKNARNETKEV